MAAILALAPIVFILLAVYQLNKGMTIKMAEELAQRRQHTANQPQYA